MNNEEFIASAREVGLSILQPSPKDLQHGLELHEACFVAESYSLGLHAPLDFEALNKATEEGASDLEFQDLVEGMVKSRWAQTDELRSQYRKAWEASGVNCMFVNAGEEGSLPMRLIKRLAGYISLCDRMPDFLGKVTDADSMESIWKSGRRSICLTTNGVPLTGDQYTVEDELRYLTVFQQLGARMMHLTYNRRNLIGDGCGELANGGLSDFGKAAVREMNRLGIIVDLAHTGWQTCLDTAKISTRPVVVSHSAAWALSEHIRCKTDEVMQAVVDTGGTIGITNIPRFLGRTGDIAALLDHIDYVTQKFGVDSVTIGTDKGFRFPDAAEAEKQLLPRGRKRARWNGLWPPGQEVYTPEWQKPEQVQSMIWTNWPLFTVGLVQRGYSDDDIAKIIGGNLLRVARQVWI